MGFCALWHDALKEVLGAYVRRAVIDQVAVDHDVLNKRGHRQGITRCEQHIPGSPGAKAAHFPFKPQDFCRGRGDRSHGLRAGEAVGHAHRGLEPQGLGGGVARREGERDALVLEHTGDKDLLFLLGLGVGLGAHQGRIQHDGDARFGDQICRLPAGIIEHQGRTLQEPVVAGELNGQAHVHGGPTIDPGGDSPLHQIEQGLLLLIHLAPRDKL